MTLQTCQSENVTYLLNLGTEGGDSDALARTLAGVLADTYVLLVKTHCFHWNVLGPLFQRPHGLTKQHCTDLFGAIDALSERIHALGHEVPSNFAQVVEDARISEESASPTPTAAVESLVDDHKTMVQRLSAATELAARRDDEVTKCLLENRLAFHQSAIKALRA